MTQGAVDVTLPIAATREHARPTERFLSPGRTIAVAAFTLFALTFVAPSVHDDGIYYFYFLRRLFGVHTPAEAYQFGSVFWTAPFWLVSQLVAVRGQFDYYHAGEMGTAVASSAAVLVTMYLGWSILKQLALPRGPAVLLLTVFGTPLWYYGVASPSYKHAADTLYATAAFWCLLRATELPARRYLIGAGAFLALLLATRYANAGLLVGALLMFAPRRWRQGLPVLATTTAALALVLFVLPVVRGIPYHRPPDMPTTMIGSDGLLTGSVSVREALGVGPVSLANNARLDLLAPYKMLFTLHRGLFVWTPLTAFATVGFLLLLRRDRRNRRFLLGLGCGALALLEVHVFYGGGLWDGGGSFSERFLTALFPFFLVGSAEFVRRTRRLGVALLTLCAVFSVFVGLVQFNGYRNESSRDSVVTIVTSFRKVIGPSDSVEHFGSELGNQIYDRWRLYWRIVT